MNRKKEILRSIEGISGKYSKKDVFCDWITCLTYAIANADVSNPSVWEYRENEYIRIMKKYTKEEQRKLVSMSTLLAEELSEEIDDVLGEIYMEIGADKKGRGQVFTPFSLARLSAELTLVNIESLVKEKGFITLNEPACGSGTMILAAASVLQQKGYDYRRTLIVAAQDIDFRCVCMTYIQCALLEIPIAVAQGNTITEPFPSAKIPEERVLRTYQIRSRQ